MKTRSKQWAACLEEVDFSCLRHVMGRHGCVTLSQALRLALAHQVEADAQPERDGVLEAQVGAVLNNRKAGERARSWKQRFAESDFEAMSSIASAHELRSRSSAVRFAIRAQAVRDGMKK